MNLRTGARLRLSLLTGTLLVAALLFWLWTRGHPGRAGRPPGNSLVTRKRPGAAAVDQSAPGSPTNTAVEKFLRESRESPGALLIAFYLTKNKSCLLRSWEAAGSAETALSVAIYLDEPWRTDAVNLLLADPEHNGFGHLLSITSSIKQKDRAAALVHLAAAASGKYGSSQDLNPTLRIRDALMSAGIESSAARAEAVQRAGYAHTMAFIDSMVAIREFFGGSQDAPEEVKFKAAEDAARIAKTLRGTCANMVIAEATINQLEFLALSGLDPSDSFDQDQSIRQRLDWINQRNQEYDKLTTTLLSVDLTKLPGDLQAGYLDRYDRLGEMQAIQWLESVRKQP